LDAAFVGIVFENAEMRISTRHFHREGDQTIELFIVIDDVEYAGPNEHDTVLPSLIAAREFRLASSE
jgi:hypothetical protein